jgi:protein O-mannosyl-transferase
MSLSANEVAAAAEPVVDVDRRATALIPVENVQSAEISGGDKPRRSSSQFDTRHLLVMIGIALMTLIAYAPVYRNDFIYLDDGDYITANPPIAKGLTLETIRWAWTTTHHGYWHPLTWLSLLADVSIFGYCAWGIHLTNVLLHSAVSIGLFVVFVRMTDEFWPSAFLAALFAVHPVHVESVAWAAERKDVLSTLFLVLTVASYIEWARRPTPGRLVLANVLFTLGLLAKPMLVTLPFGLLLLDVWPLGRTNLTASPQSRFPRRSWAELVAEKLPMFALAFAFSMVTFYLQKQVRAVVPLSELPWQPRIANVLNGYVFYLEKTVLPLHLAAFYTHRMKIPWTEMILPAVLLLSITGIFVAMFRKHPELLVGWLWFGGTLFPVSGISQSGSQAYADRFAYVPHIGLFVVLVWGSMIVFRGLRLGVRIPATLAAAVLVVCTFLSFQQVRRWHDTETLFVYALSVTKNDGWTHEMLGEWYFEHDRLKEAYEQLEKAIALDDRTRHAFDFLAQVDMKRGRFADAEKWVRKSLELDDKNFETRYRLGLVLLKQARIDESADVLEKLVAANPLDPEAQELLGSVRALQKRYDDAIAHLSSALELRGDYVAAHHQLARVRLQRHELGEAERHFREVLRYVSDDRRAALGGLFRAVYRQERWQDASAIATEALKQFPNALEFRGERALALYRLGQRDAARKEYDAIERLEPGWAEKTARTALGMATSADNVDRYEALELAEQAVEAADFGQAWALESLAAAQASLGRFDEAGATIDRALALPMLPAAMRGRLRAEREKFALRQPLREPVVNLP